MDCWVRKIRWRRDRLPIPGFLAFPVAQLAKNLPAAGDLGLISGLAREEEKGYPLQCSGLENSMDCIVHRVAKSWTRLSHFPFLHCVVQYFWASLVAQKVKNLPAMPEILVRSLGREDPLEEGMAAHSSIPA